MSANYTDAQIHAALVELPAWRYTEGQLSRDYALHGWKSTLLAAGAIAHLAELAWHHPDLTLSFGRLSVRLMSHDTGGITARDFALAEKIEAVICWQPDPASGLEGTPNDPRYAYLKSGST